MIRELFSQYTLRLSLLTVTTCLFVGCQYSESWFPLQEIRKKRLAILALIERLRKQHGDAGVQAPAAAAEENSSESQVQEVTEQVLAQRAACVLSSDNTNDEQPADQEEQGDNQENAGATTQDDEVQPDGMPVDDQSAAVPELELELEQDEPEPEQVQMVLENGEDEEQDRGQAVGEEVDQEEEEREEVENERDGGQAAEDKDMDQDREQEQEEEQEQQDGSQQDEQADERVEVVECNDVVVEIGRVELDLEPLENDDSTLWSITGLDDDDAARTNLSITCCHYIYECSSNIIML